jgi:uncharacterized membrane protein YraQ (UPF0718 family)
MSFLILSTGALALGPLLGWLLRSSAMALQALDGFVIVSILGVCVFHLLPEALLVAGPWALLTVLIGLLIPGLVERKLIHSEARTHLAVLLLAALGLGVHAFLDGAVLAGLATGGAVTEGAGAALAWGVLLHRIPVSLMIWWAFRPLHGGIAAASVLLGLGLSTVAGYVAAVGMVHPLEGPLAGHILALVSGSILHVIFHQTGPEGFSGRVHDCPRWAGAGALVALALVSWSALGGDQVQVATLETLGKYLLESAPALLLGFLAAGMVQELLPEAGVDWLQRGGVLGQTLKGVAFGLPLPICSCGVVPVYQSLVGRGVPVSAAIAFLVATPELGLDAVLLSLPLLGTRVTLVRLGAAVFVALSAGLLLGITVPAEINQEGSRSQACGGGCCERPDPETPLRQRLLAAVRYGAVELVDHTGPWILVGLLVAAVVEPSLDLSGLASLPGAWQVFLMTMVGMPLYVCAAGATPMAAVLIAKGISPGAAIAFLLAGPVTNATTFGVLSRLHGRRTAILFVVTLVTACGAAGLFTDYLSAGFLAHAAQAAGGGKEHGFVAWFSLSILALLAIASLLRQGPRGLAVEVVGSHEHSHGHHGHECDDAPVEASHDHGCPHEHGCQSFPHAGSSDQKSSPESCEKRGCCGSS